MEQVLHILSHPARGTPGGLQSTNTSVGPHPMELLRFWQDSVQQEWKSLHGAISLNETDRAST